MAKAAKKQKLIDIWKRKRWYQIIAPKMFGNAVIGESIALEMDNMVGSLQGIRRSRT